MTDPTPEEVQAFSAIESTVEGSVLIAWASQRDRVAGLDSKIKLLLVKKMEELTTDQIKFLNMQRTLIPFGVTSERFVEVRIGEMPFSDDDVDALGTPDVSDASETDMGVWALDSVVQWLEAQPDGDQRYPNLLDAYRDALRNAKNHYTLINGHLPIVVKAINQVMTLARARKYIKMAAKGA